MKILTHLVRSLRARASAARARAGGIRRLWTPPAWRTQEGQPARGRGDAETPPPEAGFPQLEVARDPELMRDVFQEHLRPFGEKAYQIRGCRPSYPHYQHPHQQTLRCTLQYTLRLEEPGTGRERVQEVTGVMYADGQTRQEWEKLREPEPGRAIPGGASSPAFAPFSYVPELDMLVQAFPYDRRLPALPLLMAGPPPELEPLLLDGFGPGEWRAEAWLVEPVRYLAEARATLRLTGRAREASSGRVEERRFYAKVYHKDEQAEQTHRVVRALWEKSAAGGEGFAVGRPVAYLGGLRTLVQEEVPGITLKDILVDVLVGKDEATRAVRRVARALAALHLDHMAMPRHHSLRKEVRDLRRVGETLQQACPQLGPGIEETVGAVIAGLEEVPPAPTHRDLGLAHIFLDGDSLALVDLDAFAGADPVLDVAHISSQLAVMPLLSLLPQDRARAAARAFTEEYFAHVPEDWRARLPLRHAGAVLKRAASLYKIQVPGWPEKVETLIGEAKNSVAGRVW